jgi:hypothetical protein
MAPRHGKTKTAEYRAWRHMITRCTNPNTPDYPRYGGRGIAVDPAWRASFLVFLADVGARPSPAHTLDRIDNDGPYAPGNVRWATRLEQAQNTRNVTPLMHDGQTYSLSEWSRRTGIPQMTIKNRLLLGWTVTEALTLGRYVRATKPGASG